MKSALKRVRNPLYVQHEAMNLSEGPHEIKKVSRDIQRKLYSRLQDQSLADTHARACIFFLKNYAKRRDLQLYRKIGVSLDIHCSAPVHVS